MEMRAVESSNVVAVGFDGETKILCVEYKGGAVYEYPNVEPEFHAEMMSAESIGKFCYARVRGLPCVKREAKEVSG